MALQGDFIYTTPVPEEEHAKETAAGRAEARFRN